MGNGRKARRHVATVKVSPEEELPKNKPVVCTQITSYNVKLDEKLNDLSQGSSGSNAASEHLEPGIKYEVIITIAHKQYSPDILPSHDEVQENLNALFRRTIEKKIRNKSKMK